MQRYRQWDGEFASKDGFPTRKKGHLTRYVDHRSPNQSSQNIPLLAHLSSCRRPSNEVYARRKILSGGRLQFWCRTTKLAVTWRLVGKIIVDHALSRIQFHHTHGRARHALELGIACMNCYFQVQKGSATKVRFTHLRESLKACRTQPGKLQVPVVTTRRGTMLSHSTNGKGFPLVRATEREEWTTQDDSKMLNVMDGDVEVFELVTERYSIVRRCMLQGNRKKRSSSTPPPFTQLKLRYDELMGKR
ncbi:hypothetical protein EDD85DRAFT_795541 [Armillaria nabsnona]|nr:hypothetical protein EDD85DRAFT_795541 [Armillaria nabsnona]